VVLDLLFSARLVAVLWGVEPREDPSCVEPGSRQAAERKEKQSKS